MSFQEHQAKGLTRLLTDVDLPPERLRIHISEVGPGERSHPPHQHPGVEALYMLAGEGTLEAAMDGAELATFFVLPEYQGQGIGTRLLAAIEAQARTQGISHITVDASLTGAAFYARMGYLRTGVERDGTAGMQIGLEKQLHDSP
jgi:GNAT superfamily N-acetyltransferase